VQERDPAHSGWTYRHKSTRIVPSIYSFSYQPPPPGGGPLLSSLLAPLNSRFPTCSMAAPLDAVSPEDIVSDIYSLSDQQLAANLEFIQEIGQLYQSLIGAPATEIRVARLWELGLSLELSLQSWHSFTDKKKACRQARPQNNCTHYPCSCSIAVSYFLFLILGLFVQC
jgi:hypothetical protein